MPRSTQLLKAGANQLNQLNFRPMAEIEQFPYEEQSLFQIRDYRYGEDWPVVYIIEGDRGRPEAYIGKTQTAYKRAKAHYKRPERKKLQSMYVIGDQEFNTSATEDIESKLIQYMYADGLYRLQNKNKGISNAQYYNREKYQAKFEIIWQELQARKLAEHDLQTIENGDLFKYSPYKALTTTQQEVIDWLINNLKTDDPSAYLVQGGPGTGKTIMATYLVKRLQHEADEKNWSAKHQYAPKLKIGLVIPMKSLRHSLKQVFRGTKGLSAKMVIGPNEVASSDYDVLVVDETHRLRRRVNLGQGYSSYDTTNRELGLDKEATQLDWILKCSKYQICFYDANQSVQPADIRASDIKDKDFRKTYEITDQMRVKGGQEYIDYISQILANQRPAKRTFSDGYEVKLFDDIRQFVQAIKAKEASDKLARIVAGYAWKWQSKPKGSPFDWDIEIDGLRLKWNSPTKSKSWVNSKDAVNEVGCIHTIQGYDLNYAGVIIGADLRYDDLTQKLVVDKDRYQDFNGKRSLKDPDELEFYIKNIYKTLLTRGVRGTYIYVCDKSLRGYFKDYL